MEILAREAPELTGDKADFEALFDRFEILAVLSWAHQQATSDDLDPAQMWFPLGRFASRFSRLGFGANQAWFDQADTERDRWPLSLPGFSEDRLNDSLGSVPLS